MQELARTHAMPDIQGARLEQRPAHFSLSHGDGTPALPTLDRYPFLLGFPHHVKEVRDLAAAEQAITHSNWNGAALKSGIPSHAELPRPVQAFFEEARLRLELRSQSLELLAKCLNRTIDKAGFPEGFVELKGAWINEMVSLARFVQEVSGAKRFVSRLTTDWERGRAFHTDREDGKWKSNRDRLAVSSAYYGYQTQTIDDADVLSYGPGSCGRDLKLRPDHTIFMGEERTILIARSGGTDCDLIRSGRSGPRFGLVHRYPMFEDDPNYDPSDRLVFHAFAIIPRASRLERLFRGLF